MFFFSPSHTRISGDFVFLMNRPLPVLFFFFFKVEISLRTPVQFLSQDKSTVAQRAKMTGRAFPDELPVSSFLWEVPTLMPGQHSQTTPTSLGQGCMRVWCNLPPALSAEWLRSWTCHSGNTGVERTPNKSQHRKLTLVKNILPPLLPGLGLSTFRSRVWRFNNK